MYDVTALGEVLIDFTPAGKTKSGNAWFEQNPGGAPANVLAALAKLNKKTAFIGKVGNDPFGTYLTQTLNDCGIDSNSVVISEQTNTTLAFVHLDNQGDRSFSFYRKPGADMTLEEQEVPYQVVGQSKIFHFGSISMTHEPSATATRKAVEHAKTNGVLISYDPNLRIPLWDDLNYAKQMINQGLSYADVVKISEEELEFLTGIQDLVSGSQMITDQYSVKLLLITLGEKGCFYRMGLNTGHVSGFKVNAVDTTGAGDGFFGGLLYMLLEKNCPLEQLTDSDIQQMITFANAVGALATTKKGAIPAMPNLNEIHNLIDAERVESFQEKYRPQFHFTPPAQWLNDPNGMVFYKGEYHLFYQHHPESTVWGPMHWGHAISKDLVHWEHMPIALAPDENGAIFSGSAVVDWNNSSGFFSDEEEGLVIIFTHGGMYPDSERPKQTQSIAYSKDKGRTWIKYEDNPILVDEEITDFRDPKVLWYAPQEKWVMSISAGDHIRIYESQNLREWNLTSKFGETEGSHAGEWECPDLIELTIDGNPDHKKWILIVSIGDNPQLLEGSRTQYFIGEFDGCVFKNDLAPETVLWLDHGRDNYAGVTWSDIPEADGRRIIIGWMSNWKYCRITPTVEWRSAMTIPRELTLRTESEGVRLIQTPVKELESIRQQTTCWNDLVIASNQKPLYLLDGAALEIEAEFELGSAHEFGFKLRASDQEETIVGYDTLTRSLFIDRCKSGVTDFHIHFPCKHDAKLEAVNQRIKLHIFVDSSSVEVFANDGSLVLTDQIFPDPSSNGLELFARQGDVKLLSLTVYELKSIYAMN